jgi:hypothetical protein
MRPEPMCSLVVLLKSEMQSNRELLLVNNIRNDVVHFRRQITRADTVMLKRFRDRLKRE